MFAGKGGSVRRLPFFAQSACVSEESSFEGPDEGSPEGDEAMQTVRALSDAPRGVSVANSSFSSLVEASNLAVCVPTWHHGRDCIFAEAKTH